MSQFDSRQLLFKHTMSSYTHYSQITLPASHILPGVAFRKHSRAIQEYPWVHGALLLDESLENQVSSFINILPVPMEYMHILLVCQ